MGHKVHPMGFRLGVIKDWQSKWYSDTHYAEFVQEDNKLREEMGSRGRKTVNQKFDIQKNGKVLFDHFINRSNGLKMKFDQKIDKTERIEKFQTLNQSEYVKR